MGKILIGTHLVWLAWYPLRGRRCTLEAGRRATRNGRFRLTAAVGPLYLGIGPGVPLP